MIKTRQKLKTVTGGEINIQDLYTWDLNSRYIIFNISGIDEVSTGLKYTKNTKLANGTNLQKTGMIPEQYMLPNYFGAGVIFEKTAAGYYNSEYGYLKDLKVVTSTKKDALLTIAASAEDRFDYSYINSLSNTGYIIKTSMINEVTQNVLTTTEPAKTDIVSIAKSYIGKVWDSADQWGFLATIAAKAGTSLPINSAFVDNQKSTDSSGGWVQKYHGLYDNYSWESIVKPGDIVFLNTINNGTVKISIVTDIQNDIKVLNVSSSSKTILPEHSITQEPIYDYYYPKNVRVYTYNKPIEVATVGQYEKPIITHETLGSGAAPGTNGSNIKLQLVPFEKIPDIRVGPGQTIEYDMPYYPFKVLPMSANNTMISDIKYSYSGLPKWLRYDKSDTTLFGTVPSKSFTKATFEIIGTLGSLTSKIPVNIVLDKEVVVDIPNMNWDVGFKKTFSFNKKYDLPYFIDTSKYLPWLDFNIDKKTISGIPPLDLIGHTVRCKIYQQDYQSNLLKISNNLVNVDTFDITFTAPINLVGSPYHDSDGSGLYWHS